MTKPKISTLKTILATASAASIMLGAGNVLAVDYTTTANAATNLGVNWNVGAAPSAGDNLIFGAAHTITFTDGASADPTASVGIGNTFAVSTATSAGTVSIADANAYTISAITAGNNLNITYAAAGELTIANTQGAVGKIDFANNAGTLTITTGNIEGNVDNGGILVINGNTTVAGTIGDNNVLTKVTVANGAELTTTGFTNATQYNLAGKMNVGADNSEGAVTFTAKGVLNVGANTHTGAVDFGGNDATVSLNGGTVTGDVTNVNATQGIITVGTNGGTIEGNVTAKEAQLGANTLNLNGANTFHLGGTTGAGTITTDNASTLVGNFGALTNGAAGANTLKAVTLGGVTTLGNAGVNIVATTFDGGHDVTVNVNSSITATNVQNNLIVNAPLTLTGLDANGLTMNAASTLTGNNILTTNGVVNFGNAAVGDALLALNVNSGTTTTDAAAGFDVASATIAAGATLTTGNALTSANGIALSGTLNAGGDITDPTTVMFGDDAAILNLGTHTLNAAINFNGKTAKVDLSTGTINGAITNGANATITATGDATISGGNVVLGTLATGGHTVQLDTAHIYNIDATTGAGTIATNDASTLVGNFGALTNGAAGANTLTAVTLGAATILGDNGAGANIVATTFGGNADVTVAEDSSITATNVQNNLIVNAPLTLTGLDANGLTMKAASTLTGNNILTTNGVVNFGDAAVGDANLAVNVTGLLVTSANGPTIFGKGTTLNADSALVLYHDLTTDLTFAGDIASIKLNDKKLTGDVDFAGKQGAIIGFGGTVNGAITNAQNAALLANNGDITVTSVDANGVFAGFTSNHEVNIDGADINILGTATLNGNEGKLILTNNGATNFKGMVGDIDADKLADFNTLINPYVLSSLPLAQFQWQAGTALTLNGATYIAATDIGGGLDSTLVVAEDSALTGAVIANANTTINDGKTLTLGDGTTYASTIDGAAAGQGTLKTTGTVALNAAVGNTNKLAAINVNGGELTFGANARATKLAFTAAGTADLGANTFTGDVDLANGGTLIVANGGAVTGAVTTTVNNQGTYKHKADALGAVGANNLSIASLEVAETADVYSTDDIYASKVVIKANQFTLNDVLTGDVEVDTNGTFVLSSASHTGAVSGAGNMLITINPKLAANTSVSLTGNLEFSFAGGEIDKAYEAGNIQIAANTSLITDGELVTSADLQLANNATFTHKAGKFGIKGVLGAGTFESHVAGEVPQLGRINIDYLDNAKLGNGTDATTHTASGDAFVTDLTIAEKATLDVSEAGYTLNNANGAPTLTFANNSGLILGTETLNLEAGNVVVDNIVNISATADATTMGNISGATVKVQGKTINLEINPTVTFKENKTFTLFSAVDGEPTTVNVASGKKYSINKVAYSNGTVTLGFDKDSAKSSADSFVKLSGGLDQVANLIANADKQSGAAESFANKIVNLLDSGNEKAAIDAAKRVQITNAEAAKEATSTTLNSALNLVSARLASAGLSSTFASASAEGMAAGHEEVDPRNGLWMRGFGSQGAQKAKKGNAGYKSTTLGGIVGADTLVADNIRIGIAAIYADGTIKMRDQKIGDKTSTKSAMFSVYGAYNIDQNWVANSIATFGSTKVKTREVKFAGQSADTGSYTSQSYAVDLGVGYRHMLSDCMMLTPEVGVRAVAFNDDGYTEVGANNTNRLVAKNVGTSYFAKAGATLSANMEFAGAEVNPVIYAKVTQNIGGKNPAVSAKLDGQDGAFISKNKPTNKTMFNLGAEATVKSGAMEYGAGYDATLASKYVAHTGTLKVRVNF